MPYDAHEEGAKEDTSAQCDVRGPRSVVSLGGNPWEGAGPRAEGDAAPKARHLATHQKVDNCQLLKVDKKLTDLSTFFFSTQSNRGRQPYHLRYQINYLLLSTF